MQHAIYDNGNLRTNDTFIEITGDDAGAVEILLAEHGMDSLSKHLTHAQACQLRDALSSFLENF